MDLKDLEQRFRLDLRMVRIAMLLATTSLALAGDLHHVSAPAELAPGSGMERSEAPSENSCRSMTEWHDRSWMQIGGLRESWRQLARILEQERTGEIEVACREFRDELDRLDRRSLLRVPDAAVRFHLARGIGELDAAARRCSAARRFDLGYRLARARRSMVEAHQLLLRQRESCAARRAR